MNTASRARIARRPVHGVLLLDKPLGLSSNQALQKAKYLLRAQKAGHTGTLDPAATGVLPLCFGAATKFAQIQLEAVKAYKAVMRLGVVTDSGDSEGKVLETRDVRVNDAQLQKALQQFMGDIEQVPPMFSALKHQGKALYEYAREGIEIDRAARKVRIEKLQGRCLDEKTVEFEVVCSKGTYVRSLVMDLGEVLGCGASLLHLQRTATGQLLLRDCLTLEALEALDESERLDLLLPCETLLDEHVPIVELNEQDAGRFLTGMRRGCSMADQEMVKVFAQRPRAFLGLAHIKAQELIPKRLLSPLEIKEWIEQNHR